MPLDEYRRKRDFSRTPEPSGDRAQQPLGESAWNALPHGRRYCVQMHRATRLHFDFRIEHGGVLLSWPIPRGPTLDPSTKRLAVQTEDHPVDYGDFEGVIPSGYGAGTVLLWDIGTYEWTKESAEDFERSYKKGDLKFQLQGQKLCGEFALVRLRDRGRGSGGGSDGDRNWLMIKKRDSCVIEGYEAVDHEVSVKTGRNLAEIAAEAGGDPREQARAARARRTSPARGPRPETPAAPRSQDVQLQPMLATSVDRPFSAEGWFYELKYDGVRALVTVEGGAVRVHGRHGREETRRYPELQRIAALTGRRDCVLDGEICVLDEVGRPSFERLQSRINVTRDTDIQRALRDAPAVMFVFDILRLDERTLLDTALRIRKKTLHDVLQGDAGVIYADHVEREGEAFFEQVQRTGVEGMVAKRADSLYHPGRRTRDWLKVKSWQTQSCVIAGFTAGQGKRREHLGALILAVRDGSQLVHCGQVGTGFDDRMLRHLRELLTPLVIDRPALDTAPRTTEPATWVQPKLVCEVRHAGWTSAGILRHPAFIGLRDELTPDDCVRETPEPTAGVIAAGVESRPGAPPRRGIAEASRMASLRGASRAEAAGPQRGSDRDPERGGAGTAGPFRAHRARGGADDGIAASLAQLATLRNNDHWVIGGRRLALTNLDKVFWPDDGITKRDMIAYYVRMHEYLLPYLRERPLSMQVFPDGITGKSFWRKDKPAYAPEWMDSWTYHGEKTKTYIVVNEVATLAWVANAGVVDLHPWHSRIDGPEQPDWAVFDLDPFEPATFADVVDIARLVKAAIDHYGMHGVIKTSGQTGLQIYVPIRRGPSYEKARGWVEDVGRAIGRVDPKRITWEWSVAQRGGKIRIDYTQNIINKTLAAPYSLRPARGAPVSTPIAWEELDDKRLRPDRWNIGSIWKRVQETGDLFLPALAADQELPPSS